MADVDDQKKQKLGSFLSSLLSGTADLGISVMPLIKVYAQSKLDPEWRKVAFSEWITTDEKAAPLLEDVFKQIKTTVPYETRAKLIMALGGLPGED